MKNWVELAESIRSATAHDDIGGAAPTSQIQAAPQKVVDWNPDVHVELLSTNLAPFILPGLTRHMGLLRYSEFRSLGVRRFFIPEAVERGTLIKVARGLFSTPEVSPWRRSPIAQVAAKSPDAVVALHTAAMLWRFKAWSDSEPLWFATGNKKHLPKLSFPVNWLRWSATRLTVGVSTNDVGGISLNFTSPARTVADFFAHRRRVKPGEPSEMLAAFRSSKHWNELALLEAAEACRVTRLVKTALRFP